ncbi:RAD50-interacting protein 1 [Hypsizygus marmoreus]|uniref:RAD50-interacting protein 1 n=1 Tax=Hypsizygus marmoreus TaxID=39966 RepID=A0A369K2J9_HYPMA|nr:RAD50-interacting protein 1 [Hypsizygus marmoreus]
MGHVGSGHLPWLSASQQCSLTMTSQQIQTLRAPSSVKDANQKAVLLVNSRFQTLDDLDELEFLVLEAQERNNELQSKLSLSKSKIDALLADIRSTAEEHLHSAQELSLIRHSLIDELTELSQELISTMSDGEGKSTLLEDIEALHRNLKELQSVKGYVEIIEHALRLSEGSTKQIHDSRVSISASSLSEYQALQLFVAKVSEACSKVEDGSGQQTLHLVQFLERIRDKTWGQIQGTLSSSLQAAAEKIGWPMPVDYPAASAKDRSSFEHAFRNLLKLQKWGEKIRSPSLSTGSNSDGLYPLIALVHPISLRFKYHFEGNRQTNRLDKPEWYFTHVLNVAHEHRTFMESVVQRLLAGSEYKHIDSWREFTLLLIPLLSRKLKHTIPSLLPHPSLLAHTIYQALTFDAALAEEGFMIQETSAAKQRPEGAKWEGVSEVILGNTEWFEAWLLGEQKFAENQYHAIISAADAWIIASDDGSDQDSQARDLISTNSARKICALIEQVTDRYAPLPQFSQRTRFLVSVQLPLLDYYHGRIVSSLDAFETLSSAFVRAVPGALGVTLGANQEGGIHVDPRGLTSGVEGVQRLCKALLSAKYVEASMRGWGDELFFVELWTEIIQNPTLRGQAVNNPLLPDPKADEGQVLTNTLFEELISRYEHLVDRAEAMVLQQVCGEIESVLKPHFTAATPPNPNAEGTDSIAISQTLLAPIALLSSHLTFLRATLPRTTLTALYRRIASRLAEHILQRQILYRGHFDLHEGRSIRAESELWVETCHTALGGSLSGGRARVEAPWIKLMQASRLASADGETWTTLVDVTFGTHADEEWETSIVDLVGSAELSREEVMRTLRRREDCSH